MADVTAELEALRRMIGRPPIADTVQVVPATGPEDLRNVREDPSVVRGNELHTAYGPQASAIRGDFSGRVTDLVKAERIVDLWTRTNQELADLYRDFVARRRARIEQIEQVLPIGPGFPVDATPAERAVLTTAWNTALERARAGTPDQRQKMLVDAERFGDDTLRRAVLTTYIDDSMTARVDAWAETYAPDTGALIREWRGLRELVAGACFDYVWVSRALSQIPRPAEVVNLPALRSAAAAAEQAARQRTDLNTPRRRL